MAKAETVNILTLIEADHRKVEQLFKQIEETRDFNGLYECFNQIYKGLTLHTRAEELVFYSTMREYEETRKYVEEAEKEHIEAETLLEEMKEMSPDTSNFKGKLSELQEAVQHHIQEEESEIFSAIRECLDDEQLKVLGQEFQDTKVKLEPDVEAAMVK